jgi:hypothetical protein
MTYWPDRFAIRQSKTILGRSYAHRDDGKRFVERADEKLTACFELGAAICACGE